MGRFQLKSKKVSIKLIKINRCRPFVNMEGRSAFKILTGKPTGKRPIGRPRRRWEDNISMDLNR